MSEKEQGSLEKVLLAGVGAIVKTAETAVELLEDLVKKGEQFFEHGKAVNEELKHKRKEHKKQDETEAGEAVQSEEAEETGATEPDMGSEEPDGEVDTEPEPDGEATAATESTAPDEETNTAPKSTAKPDYNNNNELVYDSTKGG